MRSFIKGHIRSESSTSDYYDYEIENPPRITHGNSSALLSPNFQQKPQFTSPQKSMSTPKKLLTPIKNLFSSPSHTKQPNNVLLSGDRLNSALSGPNKEKPQVPRKYEQKPVSTLPQNGNGNNVDNLRSPGETQLHAWSSQLKSHTLLNGTLAQMHTPNMNSGASWSSPALALPRDIYHTNNYDSHEVLMPPSYSPYSQSPYSQSPSDQDKANQNMLAPPLNLPEVHDKLEETNANQSSISLADSRNFETKLVSFQPDCEINDSIQYRTSPHGHSTDIEEDVTQDEDDEYSDSDSDSSSQFSFVKDNAGGRNTSVKYYKTNTDPPKNNNSFPQLNEFNENDLGYEVDEFSDYDFENNGMDDDDFNYDDDEEDADGQYDDIFCDEQEHCTGLENNIKELNTEISLDSASNNFEESSVISSNPFDKIEIETTSTDLKLPDAQLKNHRPFNHSYHLSIEGFDDRSKSLESMSEDNTPNEDILENYMDLRRLSSIDVANLNNCRKTPDLQSSGNLELYDLNSPMINGLTIGNNLRHRLRKDNDFKEEDHDSNTNKLFIFRQASLESGIGDITNRSQKDNILKDDRDIFKQRALKSFHSSISDNLDCKISEKLNEIESFNKRRIVDTNEAGSLKSIKENDVGLGILFDLGAQMENNGSQPSVKTNTIAPVNEIMGILGTLETGNSSLDSGADHQVTSSGLQEDINKSINLNNQGYKDSRLSILGMMNVLANLEKDQEPINQKDDSSLGPTDLNHLRRASIVDMMDKLAMIESQNKEENNTKRNSVTNMMATLAVLENTNKQNSPDIRNTTNTSSKIPGKTSKNPLQRIAVDASKESKRYSWYDNDEKIDFKAVNLSNVKSESEPEQTVLKKADTPTEPERVDFETTISTLDKDLIDEANQLPEDYNFEDYEYSRFTNSPINDATFFRSNSYNKKPSKSVADNNHLSNKIETINKTITFYRSNSTGQHSDFNMYGGISRGPSSRSVKSFTSVDSDNLNEERNEDSERTKLTEISNGPYTFRPNFPLYSKSTDSYNLGTISEADSPLI
ncbi:unnamed protein product [Debaryomyces tyrocola]|nr:unnamed protein product [Debaryomyces tyrocola]